MTITLRPDQEKAIAEAIESGAYQSPDEVIEKALEVLLSDGEWSREDKDLLNQKIEKAIAQLDRGEGISVDELRSRLEKRKAAWLAEQKV
jgi:Arc/MetJ-type ribon-helix-helix transcriptional regulator